MKSFLKTQSLSLANSSLFLLSFCVPFLEILASIAAVIFIIFNLIYAYFHKSEFQIKQLINFLPIYIVFFIMLVSLIYSPDLSIALKIIFKSQVIIIFPLVFWLRGSVEKIILDKTLRFYVFGVGTSMALSLLIAFRNYIITADSSVFTYYELSETLSLHPTYFSLFILSGMILIVSKLIESKIFNSVFLFISLVLIILLQSRIAIFGLLIVIIYGIISANNRFSLLFFLCFFSLLIFSLNNTNSLKNRLIEISSFNYIKGDIGSLDENGVNQRSWLWINSFNQIKEAPFLGYGLGSQANYFRWKVEKELLTQDKSLNLKIAESSLSENNLHNQYLQFFYESGVLGFFFFLTGFLILFVYLFRRKQYAQLLILIVFLIFMLTENLLQRQMGIFFYSFIFSLTLSGKQKIFEVGQFFNTRKTRIV
jgi:O-antigen ligase